MDVNSLVNQFLGASSKQLNTRGASGLSSVATSAVAGGLMGLLMGNKSTRKLVGSAATYGGMAVLGGLAFKAFQNWKQNQAPQSAPAASPQEFQGALPGFTATPDEHGAKLGVALVKAMIGAAQADGHIDAQEQKRIFQQVEQSNLGAEEKGIVFDALSKPVDVSELALMVHSLEHRAELYVASCLACDPNHPQEREYLARLSTALSLPEGLVQHLERQAKAVVETSA